MSKIELIETEWFEMKPDVYGGENMDEHVPRWNGYANGDMGDETFHEPVTFDPKDYPPGTKIVVSVPRCPKCGEVYENCLVRGYGNPNECDFDWKEWAETMYS